MDRKLKVDRRVKKVQSMIPSARKACLELRRTSTRWIRFLLVT